MHKKKETKCRLHNFYVVRYCQGTTLRTEHSGPSWLCDPDSSVWNAVDFGSVLMLSRSESDAGFPQGGRPKYVTSAPGDKGSIYLLYFMKANRSFPISARLTMIPEDPRCRSTERRLNSQMPQTNGKNRAIRRSVGVNMSCS